MPPDTARLLVALVPLSADAESVLAVKRNRAHLARGDQVGLGTRQTVLALGLGDFLGQRCLSFGSARSSNIALEQAADISPQHFVLYIDCDAGSLLIKDSFSSGVWIYPQSLGPPRLVGNAAAPLAGALQIRFGHHNRYQFQLHFGGAGIPLEQRSAYLASIRHYDVVGCHLARVSTRDPSSERLVAPRATGKRRRESEPRMVAISKRVAVEDSERGRQNGRALSVAEGGPWWKWLLWGGA